MRTTLTLAEQLAGFMGQHEYIVTNALENQIRHMREAAAEATAGAEALTARPVTAEPTPGHIDITPTAGGMAGMARIFTESADRAQAALDAFEELATSAEEV